MDPKLWEIDVNNHADENIEELLNGKQDIIQAIAGRKHY